MCERTVAFSTRQKFTSLNSYKSLDAAMRKYFCHSLLIYAAWRTISGEAKLLFHTNKSKTSNKTTQMHLWPKNQDFSKTFHHTNNSKNSNKRTQMHVRPKIHLHWTFPKSQFIQNGIDEATSFDKKGQTINVKIQCEALRECILRGILRWCQLVIQR